MKININKNLLNKFIIAIFLINTIGPLPVSYAASKNNNHLNLPEPGIMVKLSESFEPLLIKGMTIDLKDPMSFDFIIDTGNSSYQKEDIKQQTQKLIKFFLTSMTVPKDDLWVNLSPYEKDKIIPEVLEKTELGRELLAQDYLLKQITSSLMFPEEELGETFWKKVYAKAREQFGTTDIPLNTFNKVWILPDTADIYEHKNTVYIMDGKLKVMLEEDYVALKENKVFELDKEKKTQAEDVASVSSEIVREIIIPELEQEVNNGKNFAPLRQIYYSLILAEWFKQTLKSSILSKVYADKNKLVGINNPEEEFKNKIYNQYLEAFKKGVYNYIKEECDSETQQIIPRKYFAGGFANEGVAFRKHGDKAMTAQRKEKIRPTGKSLKVNTTINPGFSNKENVNLIIESGSDQFNAAVARMQGDVFLKKQLASIEEVLEGNLIIKEGELVEKYGEANVAYAHGNDNIARHIGGVEMTIDTRELDNIEEILDILTHEIVETQVVAQLVKSNKITIEELNLLQKSGYQDWLTGLKLYYETEELSPLMIAKIGFDYVKTGLNLEEMSADILKILEKAGEEKEFSMHLNSFRKAPGEIKKLALTEFARDLGNPQRFNVKDFDDVKMATLIGWAEKYIGIRIAPGEDRYSVVKFKDAEINEANVAEHFFAKVSGDDEVQEILNAAWATRSNGEFQRELMAAYAMGLYQDTTHVLEAALEKVNGLDDKTLSRTVINFIGMKIIMFRRYRNLKAMQKNFDIKNLLVVEGEHGEKLNNLQKEYGVIDLFKTALFGQDVLAGYKDMPESWYADVHKAFKTIHEHLAEDGMMLFSPSMEEFNNLPLVKLFRLLGMEERLEEYSALYQDSQFVPEFNFAPKVDHQGRMLKEELFIANKEQVESVAKVYKKLKDIAEVYDTQTAWRVLNLTIGVPLYAQRNIGPEALLSEKIDILQLISQRYNNKFESGDRESWSEFAKKIVSLLPLAASRDEVLTASPKIRILKEDAGNTTTSGNFSSAALSLMSNPGLHEPVSDVWGIPVLKEIAFDKETFSYQARVNALQSLAVIGSYFDEIKEVVRQLIERFKDENLEEETSAFHAETANITLDNKNSYESFRGRFQELLSNVLFFVPVALDGVNTQKDRPLALLENKKTGGIDLNDLNISKQGHMENILFDIKDFHVNLYSEAAGMFPTINSIQPVEVFNLLGIE